MRPGQIYQHAKTGPLVMDGTTGHVTYNVECLHWQPDHPDINLLLDARREISLLNFIWPPQRHPSGRP